MTCGFCWQGECLMPMVRRRSTVRFRNGAQVDGLIRKDSNVSWMLVGPNGCHQGPGEARCASSEGPYPARYLGHPVPLRTRGSGRRAASHRHLGWRRQIAGRPGFPGDRSPGRAHRTPQRDAQAWSAPAGCRDHASGPGARIASVSIQASQPGGARGGEDNRRRHWRYPANARHH